MMNSADSDLRPKTKIVDFSGALLTLLTVIAAAIWFFPIYWALVTSFRTDDEAVRSFSLLPEPPTLTGYLYIIAQSRLPRFYLNSTIVSLAVTTVTLAVAICAGYAISQIRFPGRRLLWWTILASFMIPVPALIVNHFIIVASVNLINTYGGIILPQLIAPVTVIVYKQFFDSVPREFREAAVMDGANEFQLLFRVFLPMNWGVTAAIGIITFIGAWNNFLWPFLAAQDETMMTVTVGIRAVQDTFGVAYARLLAGAVLAALPVSLAYLIFQRRVTHAVTLSAGIKG
jgi:multiple sugar transport system permease protein